MRQKPQFRIEDKVLIGQEESVHKDCKNVGEYILEKLKSKPDFVAEVFAVTGEQRTFMQVRERSVKCALWLKKHGIQPGDIIGMCIDNNLDTSVLAFATLYVAGIISAWDHEMSITSARFFLSLISPKLVFANASTAANLAEAAKQENLDIKIIVIGYCEGFQSLTDIIESVDSSEIDEFVCTPIKSPRDVAMICWSSGSGGLPKGAELSHLSLINCATPIEEVTYLACDPCILSRWVKFGLLEKYTVPSLKKLVVSGARFSAEEQKTVAKAIPHAQILQCYGVTDAGGLCISQARNSKPGSCGFICKGFQLKIVDRETGVSLSQNQIGEIWLRSPTIMNGYYRNPEETKKVLDSDGWLHTNDFAYYDVDGEIFFVDRISQFINYRAIKLSAAEIESVLESHPSVLKAAVVPVPHEIDEEHPMAFIVKVSGKEVTEEELMNLVETTLPWYCKLQAGVKFMDELPRTSTGKIAKMKLKEMAAGLATTKNNV